MGESKAKLYKVSGMSCAACSARVEKAVSGLEGVQTCSVNLLTGDLRVEGHAGTESVVRAVISAGYGCESSDSAAEKKQDAERPGGSGNKEGRTGSYAVSPEVRRIRNTLILSVTLLVPVLYLSMGIGMLGTPAPSVLKDPGVNGILQMVLSLTVLILNRRFFVSGVKGVMHGAPNMDTLVSLGSGISWVWSAVSVVTGGGSLYFESAAMILVLITVGKLLEARSRNKTTDALNSLIRLRPETATKLEGDREVRVPVGSLSVGDLISVRPGESVPADAVILKGTSLLNESMITGESVPVEKRALKTREDGTEENPCGENRVYAATINRNGYLVCRVEKRSEDTVLSQIIRMVTDATATKAPVSRLADRAAAVFVPVVLCISLLTFAVWLLSGAGTADALKRAICVMVISCPCALGLATPVAVMVGTGVGARNGILFKSAEVLETAAGIKISVFDKTGTVTTGKPVLSDLLPAEGITEKELLDLACTVEQQSEHPIADAVLSYGREHGASEGPAEDLLENGSSVSCISSGHRLLGGSRATMLSAGIPEKSLLICDARAEQLAKEGKTPVYFAEDGKFYGIITCEDSLRENIGEAVQELHNMGIRTVMLTGDNQATASSVAAKTGIPEVVAGVLPSGKCRTVEELKRTGRVLMIGDGINDAPALKTADIGMAVAGGTDVAMDAADIVLMKSAPEDIPAAIRLSRAVLRNIRQNLFWAVFYNALCIPLAAGIFVKPFGVDLSPMIGAAAMSLSSIFVVTNALRLNRVKLYRSAECKDLSGSGTSGEGGLAGRGFSAKETEEKKMTVTLEIKGMMCPHCEARVRTALEAVAGVESACVSHEKGNAVVTGSAAKEALAKAVTDAGYEVV